MRYFILFKPTLDLMQYLSVVLPGQDIYGKDGCLYSQQKLWNERREAEAENRLYIREIKWTKGWSCGTRLLWPCRWKWFCYKQHITSFWNSYSYLYVFNVVDSTNAKFMKKDNMIKGIKGSKAFLKSRNISRLWCLLSWSSVIL